MQFELTNAPAFMRLINEVMRAFIDSFVMVYLNDILLYSKTWDEHIHHLEQVIETPQNNKLRSMMKCEFAKQLLVYLGFMVGGHQLKIDPTKIQTIMTWPRPSTPLTELLKKWTDQCQASFDILKQMLTEAPILTLPNMARPFTLFTDASEVPIGVVSTQDEIVIAYESRKKNEAERRYPIFDQELLAIIHVIKIWKHYLKNNDFEVTTEHKPLLSFPLKEELGSRQYRWAMIFEEFKPKLTYQAGKENVVVDTLSRLPQALNISIIQ
eukprot:Gb_12471 [translate_table: standard]